MSDWVNTVAPSLEQRTESNGGKCSQLLLQRPQLPSYHSSSHGRPTFTLHFFFPASNAPHWTVCHIYRGCQWMFTSHALSVDLCRLKASKALLLVMVFSDSEIIWKCLVWICHEASSAKPWDPSDSHKFWNGHIWEHDSWQNFFVGRRDFMQQPLLKGVPWTHDTVVV